MNLKKLLYKTPVIDDKFYENIVRLYATQKRNFIKTQITEDDDIVMTVYDDDVLVGYIRIERDEMVCSDIYNVGDWMVDMVLVDKDYCNKGIASNLYANAIYKAKQKGAKRIEFEFICEESKRALLNSLNILKIDKSNFEVASCCDRVCYLHLPENLTKDISNEQRK